MGPNINSNGYPNFWSNSTPPGLGGPGNSHQGAGNSGNFPGWGNGGGQNNWDPSGLGDLGMNIDSGLNALGTGDTGGGLPFGNTSDFLASLSTGGQVSTAPASMAATTSSSFNLFNTPGMGAATPTAAPTSPFGDPMMMVVLVIALMGRDKKPDTPDPNPTPVVHPNYNGTVATITDSTQTVTEGDMNDDITLNAQGANAPKTDVINTAGGSDRITVNGVSGAAVTTANTFTDTLNAGAGNDELNLNAAHGITANGDDGNDTFNINNTTSLTANGGTGNDTFNVDGNSSGTLNGGAGDDTVVLSGNKYDYEGAGGAGTPKTYTNRATGKTITIAADVENIRFSEADPDTVNLTVDRDGQHITTDGGNDHITVHSINNTIATGDGNDIVDLLNDTTADHGGNTINLGSGTNRVNLNTSNNNIGGGAGRDFFDFATRTTPVSLNNVVHASTGNDKFVIQYTADATLFGGADDDTFELDPNTTTRVHIDGGADGGGASGNDVVDIKGNASDYDRIAVTGPNGSGFQYTQKSGDHHVFTIINVHAANIHFVNALDESAPQ